MTEHYIMSNEESRLHCELRQALNDDIGIRAGTRRAIAQLEEAKEATEQSDRRIRELRRQLEAEMLRCPGCECAPCDPGQHK